MVGGDKYVWKVDGHFRTVTTEPPALMDGTAFVLGGQYRIDHTNGDTWKSDCVGKNKLFISCVLFACSYTSNNRLIYYARLYNSIL